MCLFVSPWLLRSPPRMPEVDGGPPRAHGKGGWRQGELCVRGHALSWWPPWDRDPDGKRLRDESIPEGFHVNSTRLVPRDLHLASSGLRLFSFI